MGRVNSTPLTAEQQALAAGSRRWARSICREKLRTPPYRSLDRDVAESAADYGLCLAARSFDPAKGTWPTHAARWVKSQIRDDARVWSRRGLTCRNGGRGGPAAGLPLVGPLPEDEVPGAPT